MKVELTEEEHQHIRRRREKIAYHLALCKAPIPDDEHLADAQMKSIVRAEKELIEKYGVNI